MSSPKEGEYRFCATSHNERVAEAVLEQTELSFSEAGFCLSTGCLCMAKITPASGWLSVSVFTGEGILEMQSFPC